MVEVFLDNRAGEGPYSRYMVVEMAGMEVNDTLSLVGKTSVSSTRNGMVHAGGLPLRVAWLIGLESARGVVLAPRMTKKTMKIGIPLPPNSDSFDWVDFSCILDNRRRWFHI